MNKGLIKKPEAQLAASGSGKKHREAGVVLEVVWPPDMKTWKEREQSRRHHCI